MKKIAAVLLAFALLLSCTALAQGINVNEIHFRTSYEFLCENIIQGCQIEWKPAAGDAASVYEAGGTMPLDGEQQEMPRITMLADSKGNVQEIRMQMEMDMMTFNESEIYNLGFVFGNVQSAMAASILLAENEGDFSKISEQKFMEIENELAGTLSFFSELLQEYILEGAADVRKMVVDGRLYSYSISGSGLSSLKLETVITGQQ